MKINYEDITTKANTRKEALQALERELNDLPGIVESFTGCLEFFKHLGVLTAQLDDEGRNLLGSRWRGIHDIAALAVRARKDFYEDTGYKQARLPELIEMVDAV